jgi:hypothetical protein
MIRPHGTSKPLLAEIFGINRLGALTCLTSLCRLQVMSSLLVLCGVTLLSSCSGSRPVPRRNGELIENGRHIQPQAYAWYARALYFERKGHLQEAEFAYQAALDVDRKSGSAWASLVRVRCKNSDQKALEAAAQGLSRAVRLAPIFSERARCLLNTWRPKLPEENATQLVRLALDDARAAVNHEPSSILGNQLVVEIHQALAQNAQAESWRRAYELFTGQPLFLVESKEPGVDELLTQGNLEAARQRAVPAFAPGELAVRAYALNRPEIAKQQADMTLLASPHDADAQLVRYLTSEEPRSFLSGEFNGELSPLAVIVFVAHLNRTVSQSTAREFWRAYSPDLDVTLDPLAKSLLDALALE